MRGGEHSFELAGDVRSGGLVDELGDTLLGEFVEAPADFVRVPLMVSWSAMAAPPASQAAWSASFIAIR